MDTYISRPQYIDQLISFKDKDLIKVITGIRRCGKSTLLEIYMDYLRSKGVSDQNIIWINLESPENYELQDNMQLYNYVISRLHEDGMNYIFIDEVQTIPDFQKAIDGLFIKKNCDVYITGSNAYVLSGELATLLSGRYVEIKMLPLSFREYLSARGGTQDLLIKYRDYLENSSFPYTLELSRKRDVHSYLGGIFDSVILKDVVMRKRIADASSLVNLVRFVFDNIGNITSASKIANTMTSSGRKISVHTVDSYLEALTESFILYKANRYDIKGKQLLSSGVKYYVADIGLRYYLLGSQPADLGRILENIVFLELLRRGYAIRVGRVSDAEVDFIVAGEDGEAYYQVAYTVEGTAGNGKPILERELGPLNMIRNHCPKYLLTMDFSPKAIHNGIRQINVLDWLLNE